MEDVRETTEEVSKAWEDRRSAEELIEQYKTIKEKLDETSTSSIEFTGVQEELQGVIKQLNDKYPGLISNKEIELGVIEGSLEAINITKREFAKVRSEAAFQATLEAADKSPARSGL